MVHPETFTVTETEASDASKRCSYCRAPVGHSHFGDCVHRIKTVVLRASFLLTVQVPEDSSDETILSFYNDSSHCSDNELRQFQKLVEADGCACRRLTFELVGDASAEDEADSGLYPKQSTIGT